MTMSRGLSSNLTLTHRLTSPEQYNRRYLRLAVALLRHIRVVLHQVLVHVGVDGRILPFLEQTNALDGSAAFKHKETKSTNKYHFRRASVDCNYFYPIHGNHSSRDKHSILWLKSFLAIVKN